jgi:trans-aconitate 2-methyltransferase
MATVSTDAWNPETYGAFSAERRQPFDDLLKACVSVDGGSIVDLGCGSGELTRELHLALGAARTLGVDRSHAMLAQARSLPAAEGLTFLDAEIASFEVPVSNLVFANASLQWVDDHPALLAKLAASVAPGGQLAFQVPANFSHPSHLAAAQVASEQPFRSALGSDTPVSRGAAVLTPGAYAELLFALGARAPRVWLRVYGHLLGSTDAVVEWVSGTLLTPYKAALDEPMYTAFVERYRERLTTALGDHRPYYYAFSRILAVAEFE